MSLLIYLSYGINLCINFLHDCLKNILLAGSASIPSASKSDAVPAPVFAIVDCYSIPFV